MADRHTLYFDVGQSVKHQVQNRSERFRTEGELSEIKRTANCTLSDALGLAWPESHGLGLALKGSGLEEHQAWPGPGLGHGQGL
jgi:hypothetical protein